MDPPVDTPSNDVAEVVQLTDVGLDRAGNVRDDPRLNYGDRRQKQVGGDIRSIVEGSDSDASFLDLGLASEDESLKEVSVNEGEDNAAEGTLLDNVAKFTLPVESVKEVDHVAVDGLNAEDFVSSTGDSGNGEDRNVNYGDIQNVFEDSPRREGEAEHEQEEDISLHKVPGSRASGFGANEQEIVDGSRQTAFQLLSSLVEGGGELSESHLVDGGEQEYIAGLPLSASISLSEKDTDSEEDSDGVRTGVSTEGSENRTDSLSIVIPPLAAPGVLSEPKRIPAEGFVALDQLVNILAHRSPTPKSVLTTGNPAPLILQDDDDTYDDDDSPQHEYTGLPQDENTSFANSGLLWDDNAWQPRSSLKDEQFFDVSLKENTEEFPGIGGGGKSSPLEQKDGGSYPESYLGVAQEDVHDSSDLSSKESSNNTEKSGLSSASSSSKPSLCYDGVVLYPSLLGSTAKPNRMAMLPDASPELMHLIEAAVQGTDLTSLENLCRIVLGKQRLADDSAEKVSDAEGSGVEELSRETADVARLVVDILLAKMAGTDELDIEGEDSTPRIMLSAGASIVAGKILPWIPTEGDEELFYPSTVRMSSRTRLAKGLALILRSCTRNRAMCSAAGLIHVLLHSTRIILMSEIEDSRKTWNPTPLLDAIESLGSHSLTVKDLREWVRTISEVIPHAKSLDVVLALERAISGEEARGPSYTFEFDGESSGLLGPGESRWPFVNGYAFVTWLYIESFADPLNTAATAAAIAAAAVAKTGKSSPMSAAAAASALAGEGTAHMPRLFSFLSADNQGFEAYFHGQFLVVESVSGKGKKASLHFTFAFKPQRWYFLGLEHTYKQSLLGKADSEVRLYVDGRLHESRPLEFPRISKALGFCCIGTNPPPAMAGLQRRRRQCPLFAEMGPIYIFKEPIGPDRMGRLAIRGGDAVPSFGAGAGVPWLANNEQAMATAEESAALDVELAPRLHLLYHPKLLVGRSCPDGSPSGASGVHRRQADVLGHVHVAVRTRPTEAIWAMAEGGPMALLPLTVGAVDKDSLQPVVGDTDISSTAALLAPPVFRILSVAIQHPGNAEELARTHAPQLLANLLGHLVSVVSWSEVVSGKTTLDPSRIEERHEELVAAVVSVAQAPRNNAALKLQLYSSLLLDLKLWSRCAYGLQKKLLSTLADMVFTEAVTMRGAAAVQMLLDGCRRCYWMVPESNSIHMFAGGRSTRSIGEVNALVDELLVIIELLVGSAQGATAVADVRSLVQFVLDCPQPNQVARVLHLIYRLVVQPNVSRAAIFAEMFLVNGGIEMLLTLLQREAEMGELGSPASSIRDNLEQDSDTTEGEKGLPDNFTPEANSSEFGAEDTSIPLPEVSEDTLSDTLSDIASDDGSPVRGLVTESTRSQLPSAGGSEAASFSSAGKIFAERKLGGIGLSISADSARNNFRNVDSGDGIMVGIVSLLGALIAGGYLKLSTPADASQTATSSSSGNAVPTETTGVSAGLWLVYALQRTFQTAPKRLLTDSVYGALLPAVVRSEVGSILSEDQLALYDSGHRFEHVHLLLALLQSLPHAPRSLQLRALQDMLLVACSHPDNRMTLTKMAEWPDWLLELLICNYEAGPSNSVEGKRTFHEIADFIYSFLSIMLEHSMRLKDGWKDVEGVIHCAEWLAWIGGSSTGDQRLRREGSLPVIKRTILGALLDFAAGELQLQTQVVAAAAAGVAAGGLSPRTAKAEAEAAAQLSMFLAENALVLLMLVEDHLRLQCQAFSSGATTGESNSTPKAGSLGASPSFKTISDFTDSPKAKRAFGGTPLEHSLSRKLSNASDTAGGVSLEVLASMADASGQISALAMERLAASSAAEPFESVRCAFASYGSSGPQLGAGWKRRSHMWYGVGLPTKGGGPGGGAGGWEIWKQMLERDDTGEWVDLPLVKKSVNMLQALLLDDSGPGGGGGGGIGFGGGAGTGSGGVQALQQLLDSDQPFFAMLRIVLLSLREEDKGEDMQIGELKTLGSGGFQAGSVSSDNSHKGPPRPSSSESIYNLTMRRAKSSLLWCVLAPLLTMPLSESRRQRVLVAVCIIYSEIWHAVSEDGKILRRRYLETVIPPFAALLRRWRPLLSGIHELTDAEGQSPLAVEDRALASDAIPSEAALAFLSPAWAAAFASPPAAMALAMAAAGVGGGDAGIAKSPFVKNEPDTLDKKASRLRSFSSLKVPDPPKAAAMPKDKASAKAAALAAARDQERAAKIGSGRGLGAVAMATSAQRRSIGDEGRAKRWNVTEAMGSAWQECSAAMTEKGNYFAEKDWNVPGIKVLGIIAIMVETARKMRAAEIERRAMVAAADEYASCVGVRVWRSLIRRLLEMLCPVGPITKQFASTRIFWRLDSMENSLRMRQRVKTNYKGTDHHGEAADHKDSGNNGEPQDKLQNTPLPAGAPKLLPEQHNMVEEAIEEESTKPQQVDSEDTKEERNLASDQHLVTENVGTDSNQVGSDVASSVASSGFHSSTAIAAMAAIVPEPREKILLDVPAAMVQPSRVLRGRFKVTTRRICFIVDDRVHIDDAGVASFHDEEDDWEQVVFTYGDNPQRRDGAKDRLWPLSALREIQSRRYLLRRSALELFMVDRSNYFFNFGTTDGRQRAHRALVQARPPHLNSIYAGTQRPEMLLKKTQLSECWARREISNFEYLMQLNTLAGRTYNDMTQYPVFPWVLADYTSEHIDLEDGNVYRDLSKPIGALNHARLEKFLERYDNFDDPVIPKFHYGSHYSSAGTVLYYLMRMEPYATLAIQLQGGKFDHADRMFGDIASTWAGVLEDMSDVKELVPELFYLPEILKNENNIDFGRTQKGERIGDVKLPPWAANPVDFVQKHRAALESEHVSTNLHNWIDLIFGYKQRGKEAIAANNVFFYMTYEGTVDIDKITDPVLRKATQDQITYFGQTPSQLLTTPHVKRWPLDRILQLQTIFRNPKHAVSYVVPTANRLNVPACQLRATQDSIVTVDMDAPACHVAVHKWQPNTPDGRGLPFLFHHAKLNASSSSGALIRMFRGQPGTAADEHRYPRTTALAAPGINPTAVVAITPDGRHLLTGGHSDNSLKLVATDNARVIESAFGHCAPITCLSLSPDGSTLLTGSRDCTAILWRVHGNAGVTNSGISSMSDHSLVAAAAAGSSTSSDTADLANTADGRRRRVEGPLHVLRGHIDELRTCCVNADLDLAVSGSQRKGVLLHSITRGRFLRQLPVDRADILAISREGIVVIWDETSRRLRTYTVNGIKISGAFLPGFEGRVTSLVISSDGLHLIIGTSWARKLARSDTVARDFEPRDYNPNLDCPLCKGEENRRSKQCTHDRHLVWLRPQVSINNSSRIQEGSIDSPLVQNTVPSLILVRLHTLEVIYTFALNKGQDVTAMALNKDNTNLVVSTSDGQLLLLTDPALSIRVVDQMLRLGWEGGGLAGYV